MQDGKKASIRCPPLHDIEHCCSTSGAVLLRQCALISTWKKRSCPIPQVWSLSTACIKRSPTFAHGTLLQNPPDETQRACHKSESLRGYLLQLRLCPEKPLLDQGLHEDVKVELLQQAVVNPPAYVLAFYSAGRELTEVERVLQYSRKHKSRALILKDGAASPSQVHI